MTKFKRGRGLHRWVNLCAIAAAGIALSGCGGTNGGGSASPSAAAATAQSSTATQVPVPTQGSTQGSTASSTASPTASPTPSPTQGSTATQSPAAAQSAGTGSGTPANPPTASVGSVTINWVPPTENVDGTPLTNLAGYDIHYGTASGKYTQTIAISNPGIATYVVDNLTPGTYYFSVAAVNSQGTESPLSSEVSTTVN